MTNSLSGALEAWLETLWNHGGTDLLLTVGSPPRIRVDGDLNPIAGEANLESDQIANVVNAILSSELQQSFSERKDVDFSFSWQDRARVRGNAFLQQGHVSLSLRIIPSKIPGFAELGLPAVANQAAELPRGLVLVTGPTGSGKSTTLASIIDHINEHRAVHILTIEDPIEYVHHHKQSAVNQREIGVDSDSFERALRAALREDPDVLLVGEMRDLETIQIALTLAETGHLVFATLHTNDAAQAIDRVVDVFPAWRQDQTRVQLGATLAAVIAQRLIPKTDGGMVAAYEVLVATSPVKNLILEGKTNQIRNVMMTSQQDGMRTLEMSLEELVKAGTINYEVALGVSAHPKEFVRTMQLAGATRAR